MPDEPLLPIKVVLRSNGDNRKRPSAPRDYVPFTEVTPELRQRLVSEVGGVLNRFDAAFRRHPGTPAVAKVRLLPDAFAKSHRPTSLFNDASCPVIGSDRLGNLRVGVSPRGLEILARTIRDGTDDEVITHISAVTSIEPWTAADAVQLTSDDVNDAPIRCELFYYSDPAANKAVELAFEARVVELKLSAPTQVAYTSSSRVFRFAELTHSNAVRLANCVAVQRIEHFPKYRVVRSAARRIGIMSANALPPPQPGQLTGLVGIIDSGTDPNNAQLQAWVAGRLDMVDITEQDHTHGSFVAGLVAQGRALNGGRDSFPDVSSRIVDVAVFDRNGTVTEDELLIAIDEALNRFPHVKVWNLSLNRSDQCCEEERFSSLAAALDDRCHKHGALFVVAAGNYVNSFRPWPPTTSLEDDRIAPPGDAAHALTVGSVAHLEAATSLVRVGQPSPFSRRGPGAAYLMKPELSQPGGNCDANGQFIQTGVISVDDTGHLAEDIGVSFATPSISALAGYSFEALASDPDGVSPYLVKALLMHSAFVRSHPLDDALVNYVGCGSPGPANEVLGCRQSSATLVFRIQMQSQVFLRPQFPMPKCLNTNRGKLSAEVFMTLVHAAPVDANFGSEYCRSHVTATLGTLKPSQKRKNEWLIDRKVKPAFGHLEEGREIDLVRFGGKWAPAKFYYSKFKSGPGDDLWGLQLRRFDREEYTKPLTAQEVALVITVRDPNGNALVYDEIVSSMNKLGWNTHDLKLNVRARLQT